MDAALELLAHGYGLIEGPRMDERGSLYFSDVTNGGVFRRAADGGIETVVPRRRGVGGIALHAEGGLVISGRDICHVLDGESRILLERPDGVGGFNDLFADSEGRVITGTLRSDPFELGPQRTAGECLRIEGAGRAETLYGGVGLSNGIGFAPDGRTLYHSDTAARHVIAHDVGADGSVSGRRVFAEFREGVPDGLCVDEEGAVWVACYGGGCAQRIAADGTFLANVAVPARMVTSVCTGGADRRDLIIATADSTDDPGRGGSIYRTPLDVPGLPAPPVRL